MIISEERKKRVIDLYYNQGKTTREIAKIERMSIRDISAIIKEEESRRQKHKDQQQQEQISSQAYKLFSKGKRPVQVAIILNLREQEVSKLQKEYWKLKRIHKLYCAYTELGDEGIGGFVKLYRLMKKKDMSIEQVVNAVDIATDKLPYMEVLYRQARDQAEKMQRTRQGLANEIAALERKISVLDKTAFSSEQDCRRTEQQVQELTTKKDRLEKLIANILNGEGYSKLKQIIKQNVKDILADNKILISTAFVALLQTLKADPQMVKLIQNITDANDDKQHKDNHINITEYFESIKDRILNLGEKNYENLVEALTNGSISNAASSSSNSPFLLPQSSSTFLNLSNQSDKESESFRNSKGDVAES